MKPKILSLILIVVLTLSFTVSCKKDSSVSTDPTPTTTTVTTGGTDLSAAQQAEQSGSTATTGGLLVESQQDQSDEAQMPDLANPGATVNDSVINNATIVNGFRPVEGQGANENSNLSISSGASGSTATSTVVDPSDNVAGTTNGTFIISVTDDHGVIKITGIATYYAPGDTVVVRINGTETQINVNSDGSFEVTATLNDGDNFVTLLHRRDKNGDGTIASDEILARSETYKIVANITGADSGGSGADPYYQFQLTWSGGSPSASEGYGDIDIWAKVYSEDGSTYTWIYYGNLSSTEGNLDVDNRARYGPENIRIKAKRKIEIYVQYYTNVPYLASGTSYAYDYSKENSGPVDFTVKLIREDGAVVKTFAGQLSNSTDLRGAKRLVCSGTPAENQPAASDFTTVGTGITVANP